MITGQVQSIVFDGTRPLVTAITPERRLAFPWLIQLVNVAGNVIDLSSTTVSGTTTIGWTAAMSITQDYGDTGTQLLSIQSATSTGGGSQITFPTGGADGEVLVYLSAADSASLPSPEVVGAGAYCVFSLVLIDPAAVPYCIARGLVYPQERILGAP
jgi:hypothetical protein